MSNIIEKNGSIDDFIETLVSSPPQSPKSLHLKIETDDFENTFQVLVEIFTKSMKYLYGDQMGRVNLDKMDQNTLDIMTKYYHSFGYNLNVDKIEGANITSYGATEKTPVNENDLKAHCLKIQTKENMYVIYFDRMTEN
jgi:hypothetical protein